jgi:pimeloyl-ACP methyl ester carboxylesterase
VEDIRAAISWLSKNFPVSRRRVALLGSDSGGYIAVRAVQLHPEEFRCAIAIDPPDDLQDWSRAPAVTPTLSSRGSADSDKNELQTRVTNYSAPAPLTFAVSLAKLARRQEFFRPASGALSLSAGAAKLTRPVFIIQTPSADVTTVQHLLRLQSALKSARVEWEYFKLDDNPVGDTAEPRARMMARISQFLKEHLYDYDTKIGETEVIE